MQPGCPPGPAAIGSGPTPRGPTASLLAAAALTLALIACGRSERIEVHEPEHVDVAHVEYVPVARQASLRVHARNDEHAVETVELDVEHRSADHPALYQPIVARGSGLVHASAEQHDVQPMALALERAAGVVVPTAAGAPADSPSPGRPAIVASPPARPDGSPARAAAVASPTVLLDIASLPGADDIAVASGPIQQSANGLLVVTTSGGPRRIRLTDDARVEQEDRGNRSDLRPGQLVGLIHQPGGPAMTARVYTPGFGAPRPGVAPLEGRSQGQVSTVGTIVALQAGGVVLQTGGEITPVAVSAEVDVTRPFPAALADLVPGRSVVVSGVLGADGTIAASRVRLTTDTPPPP